MEFRKTINNFKKNPRKQPMSRPKLLLSEEQRKLRSETMKMFWEGKKRLAKSFAFYAVHFWQISEDKKKTTNFKICNAYTANRSSGHW